MYFPYVRGRQYELLALKELVSKNIIGDKVIPVIEPVKLSSTLINTISAYDSANRQLCVLLNPAVGNFINDCKKATKESKEEGWCNSFNQFCTSTNVVPSLIMNLDTKFFSKEYKINDLLIVHNDADFIDDYTRLFSASAPRYTLIPDERSFKRSVTGKKILFANKFVKKMRNADYGQKIDEPFSDEHLYFADEGYAGFSDYSIIGDDYVEAGFAPYAVAIHIVYFDSSNKLRVRHFVSESNSDTEDPAGKFYEALTELNKWYQSEQKPPKTQGLDAFLKHYQQQTYPGLGTVKKLSLMHHLELISQHLEDA